MTDLGPYGDVKGLDLTNAAFDKPELDQSKLQEVIDGMNLVTASNLEMRAKWTSLLNVLNEALKTAGLVVRIANAG